ncbi:MAG TPA: hypothetical protein VD835_16490 [Pyrinomonadaceae bacterium]|nr:hypothetical protein [Pyrinomonadaceae bacterium]
MAKIEAQRLVRRLIVLGLLMLGLVVQTATNSTQTSIAKCATGDATLICCSACEVENPPLACRRGCSPSCRTAN